jgi:uncharacterized RDD family membrane protein YckC
MATGAKMLVFLELTPDESLLNLWRTKLIKDLSLIDDDFYEGGPLLRVEQVDLPFMPRTEKSGCWMNLNLWKNYYGLGYERGDIQFFILCAEWIEQNLPNARVYYGHDVDDENVSPFDSVARQKLLGYFKTVGHEPSRVPKMSSKELLLMNTHKPAGFFVRACAAGVDAVLFNSVIGYLNWLHYGAVFGDKLIRGPFELLVTWIIPTIVYLACWSLWLATPGKILFSLKIVNKTTGAKPPFTAWIVRYLGYFVSVIPIFLGFIWVLIDKNNESWHDKLSKTIVVHDPSSQRKSKFFIGALVIIMVMFLIWLGITGLVRSGGRLPEIYKSAQEFGQAHTKLECVDQTLQMFTEKSGVSDQFLFSIFLQTCLDIARGDNNLCATIGSEEQLCEGRDILPLHCETVFYGIRAHCDSIKAP